jgi:hypothetical protein
VYLVYEEEEEEAEEDGGGSCASVFHLRALSQDFLQYWKSAAKDFAASGFK